MLPMDSNTTRYYLLSHAVVHDYDDDDNYNEGELGCDFVMVDMWYGLESCLLFLFIL